MRDQFTSEVLLELVRLMNPQRDVDDLASADQQVVYVVAGEPGQRKIVIVPRSRAWDEGTPPDVFKIPRPPATTR